MKGLRAGVDSKGREYVNASIPGTGLSEKAYLNRKPASAPPNPSPVAVIERGNSSLTKLSFVMATLVLLVGLAGLVFWSTSGTPAPPAPPEKALAAPNVPTAAAPVAADIVPPVQSQVVPYSSPSPRQLYQGPRGGIYHYSRSGRKVYERHKR
jgi:hypothetical protein